MDTNNDIDCDNRDRPLTDREKALRDRFVDEYLTDYDELKACLRLGYSMSYAKEFAVTFMHESYVQKRISIKENTVEGDEGDANTEKKRIVAALWREANNKGFGSSQSARVAALAKLSAFYGMDAPSRSQQELTGRDGQPLGQGIFVLPGLVSAEDWAAQAEAQQAALVKPEQAPPDLKIA